MKAFLCLHGFGNHPGGRRPGFSAALRRAVEARLGAKTVWKEVLWDGLLGSPDSFGTLDLALQTPALARAFYEGREVLPPPGTRGGANHRFYWKSPDVAESVAAAAVRAFSDAGIPAETGEEILLLARAAEDSLWSAGEEIELDEDGNIIAITVS